MNFFCYFHFQRHSYHPVSQKKDLFREKIEKIDLKCCFTNYEGGNEYGPAVKYIEKQFLSLAPPKKQIFVHRTCALTQEHRCGFQLCVKDILLQQHLFEAQELADQQTGKKKEKGN